MSSANVLPSAPPESIYPQISPPDFRMQKANEISTALAKEVDHYRAVAKKYKRAKKVFNWNAAGSSVLSAAFSSASFGSALSFVGLPATLDRFSNRTGTSVDDARARGIVWTPVYLDFRCWRCCSRNKFRTAFR